MEELELPGKYSHIEESILIYLYEHPGWTLGTFELAKARNPAEVSSDIPQESYTEIQYGIETLVADRLIAGKRMRGNGDIIYYTDLKLSAKGEAEAIKQMRRVRKIMHNIPRPEYEQD